MRAIARIRRFARPYGVEIAEVPTAEVRKAEWFAPFSIGPTEFGISGRTIYVTEGAPAYAATGVLHEIGHLLFDPDGPNADSARPEGDWFAWEALAADACRLLPSWSEGNWDYVLDRSPWGLASPRERVAFLEESRDALEADPRMREIAAPLLGRDWPALMRKVERLHSR